MIYQEPDGFYISWSTPMETAMGTELNYDAWSTFTCEQCRHYEPPGECWLYSRPTEHDEVACSSIEPPGPEDDGL